MSSLLSRAEKEDKEPEITLSTASLLGLFLGLVLICGVFFGFGYSVGRRSAAAAAISAIDNTEEANSGERQAAVPAAPSAPVVTPQPLGGAGSDAPVESSSPSAQTAPVTLPFVQTQPQTPAQPAPMPSAKTEPIPPAAVKQAQKVNAPQPRAEKAEAGHAMVQVAAVVHQEDADVLVAALRRRGFNAVVRNEPQDRLLHVQVGPFGSRADANATRQKLLSDGYNAIIKQ